MSPPVRAININACAQNLEIDNRISLRYYYRIADNLLKQAAIYREEKNIIDLYVILLRFSSLISETIPCHKDYQVLLPGEKSYFRKKLFDAVNELESLKPDVQCEVDEHNERLAQVDGSERTPISSSTEWPFVKNISSNHDIYQAKKRNEWQVLQKRGNDSSQVVSSYVMPIERKSYNLSLNLPRPKEETMSRHSILGPNGLRGQWMGPVTSLRVQYPSNIDTTSIKNPGLDQAGEYGLLTVKDDSEVDNTTMESVLSLDDGRWSVPADGSSSASIDDIHEDSSQLIRQPSPPPVLAQMEGLLPISPSRVADPRPGPAKPIQDGIGHSKTYLQLHIPVKMMDEFLRVAQTNTRRNLETCGVLAGSLKNRMFYITAVIIPKQESTSNSCQATNEEEIFDVQDKQSLFPLGWIHTHPSQSCFMSSVDLHTHYSYQIMLPEAVAIVMAPTDTSRTHGIFHLSDPGGVSVIRGCQQRGFHPHEEPPDGGPIYEHCSHVYMNSTLKFDVIDLR